MDSERKSYQVSSSGSNTGMRANGLRERFEKGKTVLGLCLALKVIEEMECLRTSLQKRTETVARMRSGTFLLFYCFYFVSYVFMFYVLFLFMYSTLSQLWLLKALYK